MWLYECLTTILAHRHIKNERIDVFYNTSHLNMCSASTSKSRDVIVVLYATSKMLKVNSFVLNIYCWSLMALNLQEVLSVVYLKNRQFKLISCIFLLANS